MRNDDGDEVLTTAQVARLFGVTPAWINQLARDGRLPVDGRMDGPTGTYLFRRDLIEAELARRMSAA